MGAAAMPHAIASLHKDAGSKVMGLGAVVSGNLQDILQRQLDCCATSSLTTTAPRPITLLPASLSKLAFYVHV